MIPDQAVPPGGTRAPDAVCSDDKALARTYKNVIWRNNVLAGMLVTGAIATWLVPPELVNR